MTSPIFHDRYAVVTHLAPAPGFAFDARPGARDFAGRADAEEAAARGKDQRDKVAAAAEDRRRAHDSALRRPRAQSIEARFPVAAHIRTS